MKENTEPCSSCGRPTPVGTRCVYCSTVTDLDLKSLQLDYMRAAEAEVQEATAILPFPVTVIVQKTGQRIPLKNPKVKIGRDPSNQVVIPDDTFTSRHHAWITLDEGEFWLEDLGSTNGTLLNGHPVVKRQVLSAGDKIRVGHTELTFEAEKT
jgi:pSer/pThr/pTyr-binding forkhead associated (FHA) protein